MKSRRASMPISLAVVGVVALPLTVFAQSGGVVVDNPAPDPTRPAFRISARPTITVGGLNDDERYELQYVTDAMLTETGKLVIIPESHHEIRVFDAAGRFVTRFGRRGQGPGEFIQAVSISPWRGDSVLTYDNFQARITLFDERGNVVRTWGGISGGQCCLNGGRFLTRERTPGERTTREILRYSTGAISMAPPTRGDTAGTFVSSRAGTGGEPVLVLEGNDPSIMVGPLREPLANGRGTLMSQGLAVPFISTASVRLAGDVIVYGRPGAYEFRVYSPTGALVRTVRSALEPAPVTARDIALARVEAVDVDLSPQSQRMFEEAFDKLTHPPTMPAYGRIAAEPDGTVWVMNYAPQGSATEQRWARFDPSGRLLGTLRIPDRHNVVRFSRGHVILRVRNSDTETTTVYVHRIEATGR